MTSPQPEASGKGWRVLLACMLAVAVTGYFVGLRQSRQASLAGRLLPDQKDQPEETTAIAAPRYGDLPTQRIGPNRGWNSDLEKLTGPPLPSPPKTAPSRESVRQTLVQRAQLRAFEGAPPSIPHPASSNDAACLLCHRDGKQVGDKFARRMSHPPYVQCTQCHVEAPPGDAVASATSATTVGGFRAFSTAPPAIPHPAWMRTDCLACHGITGPAALRTTHPERISCLQCHALTSPLDPAPGLAENRP